MSRPRVRLFGLAIGLVATTALGVASAQEQKVAVINLARDQAAGFKRATSIRIALEKSPNFSPLQNGELQRNLEAPLPAEDVDATLLTNARQSLESAREELSNFRKLRALSAIRDGNAKAMETPPSAARNAVLADLAFLAGQVHLSDQNRGLARSAFELALRLVPDHPSPDPGRFDPDIVAVFKEARATATADPVATVKVSATYDGVDVYLDGALVGKTPIDSLEVPAGTHLVTVWAPDYQVANKVIEVGPGDAPVISLNLDPQKVHDVAMRLRRQAIAARVFDDPKALEGLARRVQELTGASFSFVIRGDDALELAFYQPRMPVTWFFPASDERTASLIGLVPPVVMTEDDYLNQMPRRKPWHERTSWRVGGASGVAAVILGAVLFTAAVTSSKATDSTGVLGGFPL